MPPQCFELDTRRGCSLLAAPDCAAVGRTMPISINLWVPARGQSRDSCDHYKLVSNLDGCWLGLWGGPMTFV